MAKEIAKLRDLSADDLRKEENGLREEIWKLRLQVSTGQLEAHRVRGARKDLARVLTVLRERELAEAQGQGR